MTVEVVDEDNPVIAAAKVAGGTECPVDGDGLPVSPDDVLVFQDELLDEDGGHGQYTVVLAYPNDDGSVRLWYEWTEAPDQVLAVAKVAGGYPAITIPVAVRVFQGRHDDVEKGRGNAA